MEVTQCRKCGRLLRDPESIARGMGPECAGITGDRRKRFSFRRHIQRGSVYLQRTEGTTSPTLFSLVREKELEESLAGKEDTLGCERSDHFSRFPRDLVDLVLLVSPHGTGASHRARRKSERISRGKVLKEIRRMCIKSRLAFWPGVSRNGEPIACVPYGDDGWRFENSDRVLSSVELEAYLIRYRMISPVG